jgi:hypothetical protein
MTNTARFRDAVVAWAANGVDARCAARLAPGVTTAVLVEGASDAAAIETLARRCGRDLDAEGIAVIPLGGATSIGRFLDVLAPPLLGIRLAGLCDAGEEGFFQRGLTRIGLGEIDSREHMEGVGFFVCVADLEDELIRALGVTGVEAVIEKEGDLEKLRTFHNQPAQRDRTIEHQLRRFMGTTSGRKAHYAAAMVNALDSDRVPLPLARLLAFV